MAQYRVLVQVPVFYDKIIIVDADNETDAANLAAQDAQKNNPMNKNWEWEDGTMGIAEVLNVIRTGSTAPQKKG
jgi:hypothetical protein